MYLDILATYQLLYCFLQTPVSNYRNKVLINPDVKFDIEAIYYYFFLLKIFENNT